VDQTDTNVWFLAGTFGGTANRDCTIPNDKAILFPVINLVCTFADNPDLQTNKELQDCAVLPTDKITVMEATVDGAPIRNLTAYQVQSPLFNVTLPENNVHGLRAQTTQGVADGIYIILEPLPKGPHNVHFKAALIDPTVTSTINFATESNYHLLIE
jgi:hypothetical protein